MAGVTPYAVSGRIGAVLGAFYAFCGSWLWATVGHAEAPALGWSRLPGAESCISPLRLARLVEARVGHPVLEAPSRAGLAIEGYVESLNAEDGSGFAAYVVIHDPSRGEVGRRTLRTEDPDCHALDLPLSLVIALAIDADAALPLLIDNGGLSKEARGLLDQLQLPSADPDAALALLVPPKQPPAGVARKALPNADHATTRAPGTLGAGNGPDDEPATPMVMVSQAELRRLRALARSAEGAQREHAAGEQAEARTDAVMPNWPGWVMLASAGAFAAAGLYSTLEVRSVSEDADFTDYRDAVARFDPGATDACAEAESGFSFGQQDVTRVNELCQRGDLFNVLQWVFYAAALGSAAAGGSWLLWIGDAALDTETPRSASLRLAPALSPDGAGAVLRLRL